MAIEIQQGALGQAMTTKEEWSDAIWREWQKSAEGFLRIADLLLKAKAALPHGSFEAMVETDLPFGARTAQRLMVIGNDEKGRIATYTSVLPPSWMTQYLIASMPDDAAAALPEGFINPSLQQPDLKHWLSEFKRQQKHQNIAVAASQTAVIDPGHRFSLIYADPPWQFHTYSQKGKDMASPDNHYPTMPLDDIKDFRCWNRPMVDVADDDCILFLWCTPANLLWGIDVLEAWGFTYKTHMVWVKDRSGTGYYALQQHEPLLIGTRGAPAMPESKVSSVIMAPRREHSRKPDEGRKALDLMYPHWGENNKLEVFSRGVFEGWSVYGNQAFNDDVAAA